MAEGEPKIKEKTDSHRGEVSETPENLFSLTKDSNIVIYALETWEGISGIDEIFQKANQINVSDSGQQLRLSRPFGYMLVCKYFQLSLLYSLCTYEAGKKNLSHVLEVNSVLRNPNLKKNKMYQNRITTQWVDSIAKCMVKSRNRVTNYLQDNCKYIGVDCDNVITELTIHVLKNFDNYETGIEWQDKGFETWLISHIRHILTSQSNRQQRVVARKSKQASLYHGLGDIEPAKVVPEPMPDWFKTTI